MKMNKILSGIILLLLVSSLGTIITSKAEEVKIEPKEQSILKSMTLRETEILGTLEKPQFSTEIPWRSPSINNLMSPEPNRSFKMEIYRPIHPFSHSKQSPK